MKRLLCLFLSCVLLFLCVGCARKGGEIQPPAEESEENAVKPTADAPTGVAFTDELFGENITRDFYNYAPSAMIDEDGVMHVWYCSNRVDGLIVDHIVYRRGTPLPDGRWSFSEKQIALKPGADDAWDCVHDCDPSVVRGTFRYGGEDYTYLMAFLGCKTRDSTANEVGLAFAKDPAGPWVKYGANPIANYYAAEEYDSTLWGYGQPSLVSADKGGRVFLFYTKGVRRGTFTHLELWDFSNADAPALLNETDLPNFEVALNNADFAYDPAADCFYCVKEDHVPGTWEVGSVSVVAVTSEAADIKTGIFGDIAYEKKGTINQAATGCPNNHNAGLVTDPYGYVIEHGKVPVIYTGSEYGDAYPDWRRGEQWAWLHTFRLYGYLITF